MSSQWILLGCVSVAACVALSSGQGSADEGRVAIQPAVYRTTASESAAETAHLVNHRYRGGGFNVGIYSGPRWGYGGYGGYYYRPYYGYGYSSWSYPRGFYPGGYYYSSPGYGWGSNYGYYGCY